MNYKRLQYVKLPPFTGIRVMMMPFHTHDVTGSLPEHLHTWADTIRTMCELSPPGTGYVTIDEALVLAGDTHRRPGIHVDGVGPDGRPGGWGGGGGWGVSGMTMVASHAGCVIWDQDLPGAPGPDGDCDHLAEKLDPEKAVVPEAGFAHYCGPLTAHAAVPMPVDTHRQFCRVSFPSDAPWYEGYTRNPLGIEPAGPVHPRRTKYMGYRP